MSDPVPFPEDPFGAGFDFSQLDLSEMFRIMQSPGPVNWEIAKQLAVAIANGEVPEKEIASDDQEQLSDLVLAAKTLVANETGIAASLTTPLKVLTRADWATAQIDSLRPVIVAIAGSVGKALTPEALEGLIGENTAEELGLPEIPGMPAESFSTIVPMLAPLLLGVQAGSMIGHLARHSLGIYDLPLPTEDSPTLVFVVGNINEFEEAWSLERSDIYFYMAIHELVHASVRSIAWVRRRLVALATDYVSAYEFDGSDLGSGLEGGIFADLDPSDPSSIQALADHPEELLGALRNDRQRLLLDEARVFHAVLEGYADTILERTGRPLIVSFDRIHEAMARHRIERGEAERFIEGLLGMGAGREDFERGSEFCRGVVERGGIESLHRLWENAAMEPTANELVAPGLWLARIELDESDIDRSPLDEPEGP